MSEPAPDAIELVIEARARDIGDLAVRRVLPFRTRRLVGPFIFFDHMGPHDIAPGSPGGDVLPHPHIGLATVTYLFEGEILHRDSVGSLQPIRPGDVNWMTAGRGIAHSERMPPDFRAHGGRLHGIQTWVALSTNDEDGPPRFDHHTASTIPLVRRPGVELRVIAGQAYGASAPTRVSSPTFYVHARFETGAELEIDDGYEQRAIYAASGAFQCEGRDLDEGNMFVLRPRTRAVVRAIRAGHLMVVGGAPLDGPRHIFWNFVSSSKERIERAKADWKAGRFAKVVGDETDFVPLPESYGRIAQ
jgi:redox-sensitive bicupin YhaK (pirin superfamily)